METTPVFVPTRSRYVVITADYIIPLLLTGSILFAGWFALCSPYMRIAKVNCYLDYQECENEAIIAELDKLKGQNILLFSPTKIKSRLTGGDYTIREVDIVRTLPNTVSINLESVYPVVALKLDEDSKWIALDKTFKVIGIRQNDPNVPTVIIKTPLTLTVGRQLEESSVTQALRLAINLGDELPTAKTIMLIDEDTVEISLSNGLHALFTPKKDTNLQIKTLQSVLVDDTITRGMHMIDVRFSQPVLR